MATGSVVTPGRISRPAWTQRGIGSWLTSTDHKKIGLMYMFSAFAYFLIGGLEALLIRTQLSAAHLQVLDPEQYDQIFTMHGTTMIFLFVMPMTTGLGNYLVPLMIGARDMAFPRLNALGYWMFLFGGLFLYTSFALRRGAERGLVQLRAADRDRPVGLVAVCGARSTSRAHLPRRRPPRKAGKGASRQAPTWTSG